MYLPVPVLVAVGIAFAILVVFALRRRGGGQRDLIAPPRAGAPMPPPAWPAAAPQGSGLPPEVEGQVRVLVGAGQKIEAIKLVREATAMGLREAKDLVERM
jgi:hypothetical protein